MACPTAIFVERLSQSDSILTHNADSDEVARVKRDEAARDSWMMAPAVTE
jgi:hypothetical protein